MELDRYLKLMEFPPEWISWEILPLDFITEQARSYQPGHETSSEHDRHATFQWWLKQHPSAEKLVLLARLTWLDPDQVMADSIRQAIASQPDHSEAVATALTTPYHRS